MRKCAIPDGQRKSQFADQDESKEVKKMLRKKKQINMLNGNLRGYRRIKNDFSPFYLSIILYFFYTEYH